MDYEEVAKQMAPLEAFEPGAFTESAEVSRPLCDFVLALAVIYNDFKDVLMGHELLSSVEIGDRRRPTPQLALHNGVRNGLLRIQAAVVHELIALIKRSEGVLSEPFFERLERQLSTGGREAWRTLRDIALDRSSADPLAKVLLLVRHKVAFHYDAEQIGLGFRYAFVSPKTHGEPLLCRGTSLAATRFCFADAAAQSYVAQKAQSAEAKEFLEGKSQLLHRLHHALFEIVTRFIQARGYAWRKL
jgi:hypothetical protein